MEPTPTPIQPVPLSPSPIISAPPVPETPPITPPAEIPPTPQEEKGFPGGIILILGSIILVAIVGFLLFFLTRSRPQQPTPKAPIISPTATITTQILPPKIFSNDFIKFEYPGNAKQVRSDQASLFELTQDGNPTGNFIRYITSSLGTFTSLQSWITNNEKCGTPDTRKGTPYTNPSRLQGIRINNLGGCPPSGSSVIDAFYLNIGKTVHAFYLHQGGVNALTETEQSAFNKLVDSILLNPTTKGSK